MQENAQDTNFKREQLKRAIPTASFAKKVNLMRPEQVTAIYLRLKDQSKLK